MRLLVAILLLILVENCYISNNYFNKKASSGFLDLRDWDGKNLVKLHGEWTFFPDKIYNFPEIVSNEVGVPFKMPSSWNDLEVSGKKISGKSVATFILRVKLPENVSGEDYFAIRAERLFTASKIFIDNELILENGILGEREESTYPSTNPKTGIFKPNKKNFTVVIQIANFHHKKGGILGNIYFGKLANIEKHNRQMILSDSSTIGLLFMLSVFFMSMYIKRNEEKGFLLFSVFCFFVMLRAASTSEKLISEIIFFADFFIYTKIEFITYYSIVTLVIHYLYIFYDEIEKFKYLKYHYGISILFILFCLSTPPKVYSETVNVYLPIFIFQIIYILYFSIQKIIEKREFSKRIGFINLLLLPATINDILNTLEIIHTGYISQFVTCIVMFTQSFVLATRYANAYKKTEELSTSLKEINSELEQRVFERTNQYRVEKEKAESANQMKDRFISLLSHDLKTPILGVYNITDILSSEKIKIKEEEKIKYIGMIKKTSKELVDMIDNILHKKRFTSKELQLFPQLVNLSELIENTIQRVKPSLEVKSIQLINKIPKEINVKVDKTLFTELILNLLSNSLKFTPKNGSIEIGINFDSDRFEIQVKDNGIGIPSLRLENLFLENKSSTGTEGESGTGIGLLFCKEIVEAHEGVISIESKEGYGTTVRLQFEKQILRS
ncbi:MAG: sensor histidine kinase [Leptospiraceae bacterium]|nr:sensor histidine kinase [Leptospiraceae bacterium]